MRRHTLRLGDCHVKDDGDGLSRRESRAWERNDERMVNLFRRTQCIYTSLKEPFEKADLSQGDGA